MMMMLFSKAAVAATIKRITGSGTRRQLVRPELRER